MRILLSGLLILFLMGPAAVAAHAGLTESATSTDVSLARTGTWRSLLGYPSPEAARSDITSGDFFLAPNGNRDPGQELHATIEAMRLPVQADPDNHAQCRYPARKLWLGRTGLYPADAPQVHCPKFETWLGETRPEAASLIFASGNLSNPASFYGHMLLRFHGAEAEPLSTGQLLQNSINYGAIYPTNENGLVYILKGLFGGYPGTFTSLAFYQHLHEYNEQDARDLWEYRLNLSREQVEMLAALSWEMMTTRRSYYFLRQNCAYEIARLLETVTGTRLVPSSKPWVLPVDILERVSMAKVGGQSLLEAVRYLPSKQSRFREGYFNLDSSERGIVRDYVRAFTDDLPQGLEGRDKTSRNRILEALIDYSSLSEKALDQQRRSLLLAARMADAPGRVLPPVSPPTQLPHEGQKSSLVELSALVGSGSPGLELHIRPAFNDFLGRAGGALPYSELAFGDLRAEYLNRNLTIRSLDVVSVTTLRVSPTGLRQDSGTAWRLKLGARQAALWCNDCLAPALEGAVGKSAWLSHGLISYVMADLRVAGSRSGAGRVAAGPVVGLITSPERKSRARIEAAVLTNPTDDSLYPFFSLEMEAKHSLTPQWDLGVSFRHERRDARSASRGALSLARYW